jgi:hypothetical protein
MTLALALLTGTTGAASATHSPTHHRLTASTAAVKDLRHGVVDRRSATWRHQDAIERPRTRTAYAERRTHSPLYLRWLKRTWAKRADKAYRLRERLEGLILRDYAFSPGNHAWPKAVREVQRVFPGTESWLLSCSAAEGGHGRWVGYGGVPYSTWLRDSNTVGGPMQFRFGTFTGMFRRGSEYARARGFILPSHLSYRTTAWRSALGQAIAAGWARYTGNDDSHWSASWGNGC